MSYQVIVVGVDDSETALKAAQEAAALARSAEAKLHVVTAFQRSGGGSVRAGSESFEITALDNAESVAASVAGRVRGSISNVTSTAVEGKPAEALMKEAKRLDADLIVVGNRRMQGPSRVLGSVANEVTHNADCSVLVVKTV